MTFAGICTTSCALAVTAVTLLATSGCAQTTTAVAPPAAAVASKTEVTELLWLGQASFRIKTPGGKTIVVDPWITGGTKTPAPYKTAISALGKVDLLLVTQAHADHIGDAPALAKLNNTKLYGPADMITPLVTLGVLPADLTHRFNKSGSVTPLPGIKVTAVNAEHSSLLVHNKPDLVLTPTGGNLMIGPDDAAFAMRHWISSKNVIPIHPRNSS